MPGRVALMVVSHLPLGAVQVWRNQTETGRTFQGHFVTVARRVEAQLLRNNLGWFLAVRLGWASGEAEGADAGALAFITSGKPIMFMALMGQLYEKARAAHT